MLARDELKLLCAQHGLDDAGRARATLMARLLEAHGAPKQASPPSLFSPQEALRSAPRAGDIVQLRHRQWLVERVVAPPAERYIEGAALPRGLSQVARPLLEQLYAAVERGRMPCPVTEIDLLEAGLGAMAQPILAALGGLDRHATSALLRAVLAERVWRPPPRLDLVWSGPDAEGSVSRDTGLVVKQLFEAAQREVIVGGYAFDTPEILAPLHAAMKTRGVAATLFLEIDGHAPSPKVADEFATRAIERFFHTVWTFGPPRPDVYWDPRTTVKGPPWASLHTKCVVVDGVRALVTSANFTDRGQSRNIEVGALIEDAAFAGELLQQWRALIAAGLLRRYMG